MSITASWLVLAVVILRLLLKKAPKALSCALWALVAIRLVCPFSFESMFSLIPSAETVPPEIVYAEEPIIDSGIAIINQAVNPIITETFAPTAVGASVNPIQIFLAVIAHVWVLGIIAMVLYALISYLRLRKQIKEALETEDGIWLCDHVSTPFILGIFRPRIILPSSMEDKDVAYVVAHERAHLKRRDHWWKPLGFALLTVYWFNPLLWVAYILLCRDIELACDERVIKEMGTEDKKAYTSALLNCSIPRKMISACPLAFGEVGVKQRIKTVLHYKKPAFWIIVVAVLIGIAVAVAFLTNPKSPESQNSFETADGYTDCEGVDVNIIELFLDGEDVCIEMEWDNRSGKELNYGLPFTVYRHQDGNKVECGTLFDKVWSDIAYVVLGKTSSRTIRLEGYDLSEAGDYSIEFTFWNGDGNDYTAVLPVSITKTLAGSADAPAATTYEVAVAHANYIGNDAIYTGALNRDKMAISSVQHLPIRKFESTAELDKFKSDFADDIAKGAWDEVPSFDAVTTQYDENFFKDNTLFVVYVMATSGSCRYDVGSVYNDGENFVIHAEITRSPATEDLRGWFLCVSVDKDSVKTCTSFDADLNAISNAEKLIGKWETVATVMGAYDEDVPKKVGYFYSFAADGTGIETVDAEERKFTYTTEGRLLTMRFPKDNGFDDVCVRVYSVDGDILTLSDEMNSYRSGTLAKVHEDADAPIENYEYAVAYAAITNGITATSFSKEGRKLIELHEEPLRKFDSKEAFDTFKTYFADVFMMDKFFEDVPSFNTVTEKYDADFFENNVLFVWYIGSASGSVRYTVDSIEKDGEDFVIHCAITNFDGSTDYRHWFITVAVAKEMIEGCTDFRAQMHSNVAWEQTVPYHSLQTTYAGIIDNAELYADSLNSNKLLVDGVQHLPIRKFESVAELTAFKDYFADDLPLTSGYEEIPAFADTITQYDDAFFKENVLFVIYLQSSVDARFSISNAYIDRPNMVFHVANTVYGTSDAVTGWFLLASMDKRFASYCTEFDADLNAIPFNVAVPIESTITELPSGRLSMQFFGDQDLPEKPKEIDAFSFCFAQNGNVSFAHGENKEYIDNAMLRDAETPEFVFSFSLYQDSFEYTEPLLAILNSVVTVDYEGNRFDTLALAQEHVTVKMNGEAATLSEVRLGAGNGHRDFYFTFNTDTEISMKEIRSFSIEIK